MKFCSLRSGSSGNAAYIGYKDVHILVDAGLSGSTIEKSLESIDVSPRDITAILITHEHNDHIKGAGVLSRRYNIPIYANEATWASMENLLGEINCDNKRFFKTGEDFTLGDVRIRPFKKSHDAVEPVGFSFFCGQNKATIATDLGYISRGVAANIMDSDIVMLESNHDVDMLINGSYPWTLKKRILSPHGHLSNKDAAEAIKKFIKLKSIGKIYLGHLSQNNNKPEIAYKTVIDVLKEEGIDYEINMALRYAESDIVEI
ncbi:MBL fold metallo-hydrolase [Thermoanaerobacterium thermosaccharolyticum]|uniref:MBL fold metallo-hydrolase n=1 Tax=Thermoanaerobacterium thermosaccharolyticum TaxID=1517 RepID=UPI00177A82B0|nr:MBL fold metallo-hydrolase [Thermoanaerobacterium thermosaccharolyticum]MBE0067978.1 MBL fold metallo-hydrolase [Thermoanaerobacterium thermosaccharolyticum]MBE0227717.1 MBL fold metallo-hydrolase [Thermoanaerobacterium thermosaccharolyticum]